MQDIDASADAPDVEILALDAALDRLKAIDERQSQLVELRFFGGLTVDETAVVLGSSADHGQAGLGAGPSLAVPGTARPGGMTKPEKWERIGALFQRALELPVDERAEFLRQQCGDDESVRGEVASLVEAHAEAEGFLDRPAHRAPEDVPRLGGSQLGVFEILERLGAGGMGEVYRARDTRLDRLVAVKVLSADLAGDPRGRERFEREAHIISKLTHPHICTLLDVGSASVQGVEVPFLVMELLEGETLATRLARGPLPRRGAAVCDRDCRGARRGHALGIVHRDFKPANIMLTKAGWNCSTSGWRACARRS